MNINKEAADRIERSIKTIREYSVEHYSYDGYIALIKSQLEYHYKIGYLDGQIEVYKETNECLENKEKE